MLSVSEEGPRARAEQILLAKERVQRITFEGEERQKTGQMMETTFSSQSLLTSQKCCVGHNTKPAA